MTDVTYNDEMDLLTSHEEKDWQRFLQVFEKKNHKPELLGVNLGWRFWLALGAGVGAVALSSFRTGPQFYDVAFTSSHNEWLAWGEGIAAVLSVNMSIVALSTVIAYITKRISNFSLKWGLRTAILISALAGLGQAVKGLEISWAIGLLDNCLAVVMGIGVTALEYFGGDLIGVELVRIETERTFNKQTFDERTNEWFAKARKEFPSWVMRKTNKLHSEPKQTNHQVRSHSSHRSQTNIGTGEQTVRSYLEQYQMNEQRILGVSELARLVAANEHSEWTNEQVEEFVRRTKGYISQVRSRWISEKENVIK